MIRFTTSFSPKSRPPATEPGGGGRRKDGGGGGREGKRKWLEREKDINNGSVTAWRGLEGYDWLEYGGKDIELVSERWVATVEFHEFQI